MWLSNSRFAMNRPWPVLVCGALAAVAAFAKQPQPAKPVNSRDVTIVPLSPADKLKAAVQVPRGYAVVIGISKYKNLTEKQNLGFAETDAENMYSTLISKEGGNFEFENVKKLVGPQATSRIYGRRWRFGFPLTLRRVTALWFSSWAMESRIEAGRVTSPRMIWIRSRWRRRPMEWID